MTHRAMVFVGLMLAASACATATPEMVKQARATEYVEAQYPDILKATVEVMEAQGYVIEGVDAEAGVVVSTGRWYSKEGMRQSSEAEVATIHPGSATFRIGVEFSRGKQGLLIHVDGGAQGYVEGSPQVRVFKHGDPDEPYWVEGKIQALETALYQRLEAYRVATSPSSAP